MTDQELQKKLLDFEASEEFASMMERYQSYYRINSKPMPTQHELKSEVLYTYKQRFITEKQCETEGHQWEETNVDGENGCNDLECQRCGLTHYIQW